MFKTTLAISALLGSSYAQKQDHPGLSLIKGFSIGSGTSSKAYEYRNCMKDDFDNVVSHAKAFQGDFRRQDFNDIVSSINEAAAFIDVITSAKDKCSSDVSGTDYDTLTEMSEAWQTPITFAFGSNQVDFVLNGQDVSEEIKAGFHMIDNGHQDYFDFGKKIGEASIKVLQGKKDIMGDKFSGKPKTPVKSPKIQYAKKNGAELAAGFLFGARVGGFDEMKLYDCLDNEDKADQIFLQADQDLKESIVNDDADQAVKGFYEMIGFIIDMSTEQKDSQQTCSVLNRNNLNMDDAKFILQELKDEKTGIKYLKEKDQFTFNRQDISKEVGQMAESYMRHDFKKVGFMLGDTLDKHLKDKPRPPIRKQDNNNLFLN